VVSLWRLVCVVDGSKNWFGSLDDIQSQGDDRLFVDSIFV
jgi:hypothetical protein